MVNTPRATPIARYLALVCLLVIAIIYQVRYTEYRFPNWFGKQAVDYPFFLVPDDNQPGYHLYVPSNAPRVPGIENGEELLAIDGKPVTGTAIFGNAIAHSWPGDSLRVTVRASNGSTRTVTIPLGADKPPSFSSLGFWLQLFLYFLFPWFCVVLGFWVAAIRVRDVRSWILLALMLSFAAFLTPGAESWERWLRPAAMAYHRIASVTLPIWLLLLGIHFPEPFPPESRWAHWMPLKWLIILPLAFLSILDVLDFVVGLQSHASIFWLEALLNPLRPIFYFVELAAILGMVVCLAAKFKLAISPDTKRRLRFLVAGTLISLGPVVLLAVIAQILGVQMEQYFPEWLYLPAWMLFFLFPPTLAYVILVHRAMGISVVVRQGLQYALAQRGVRVVRTLIGVALGLSIYALLKHAGGGPLYYVILALGIAFWLWLRRLLSGFSGWVDRRFFRDVYNAEQFLAELSESVRSIVETYPLLATVAGRISQSMHVPQIAVLTNGSGAYRPSYALGYNPVPPVSFSADAATVRQLRESKEPARVYLDDPNSWIYRAPGTTAEERTRLAVLRAELLLPLSVKDQLLGFISLSPKRSEEPYSPSDVRLLQSVAAQTGLALEVARLTSAVSEEIARRERLSRELEIAREVQERLFPQHPPEISGLDYCGACRPALGVGGDYYDFLPLAGGQLGIALGDVSGKGIAAALMMASLQASLRAEASRATEQLGPMIAEVNRLLYEASTQNRYATFFYAQYNPATRRLVYVNAGHNAPMLFTRCSQTGEVMRLAVGGIPIGLVPSCQYSDAALTLEEGDLLVVYTDGISETMNAADEEWGEENLIKPSGNVASCRREKSSPAYHASRRFLRRRRRTAR